MGSLSAVWSQVTTLLSEKISIIPVRDKDSEHGVAKSPYNKWKQFQDRIASEDELWTSMEQNDTTAIATICGKISGNLEVIDIDVKYKPGIDATIFKDIRAFYPELFTRLRVHKTPSTGYHILYRISDHEVPGNQKLAGRLATQGEIELQISKGAKRPNKEINFLETRGEGGYVVAPPSLGYTVHNDVEIPVITWEERCSLITLCQTYNEIVRESPTPKAARTEDNYYDENPFDHFNNVADPVKLIESFDWKFSHENNHFIWFTRPGKTKGVSASWNKQKKIYYIFTSSTELQPEKGYHPATLLAELKFSGDKKKTYQWLVTSGYGKLKQKVEQQIIKSKAVTGGIAPANLSKEAKQQLEAARISYTEDHPHGIFWLLDEDGKITIDREGIYQVSHGLGFRLHEDLIVRIKDIYIHNQTEREYFDAVKEYIREDDADLYRDICNSYESFIQKSGSFTVTRLRLLETEAILCDGHGWSYKFYTNKFIKVTSEGIEEHPYDSIQDKLIWHYKVLQREWVEDPPQQFKYTEFLHHAIGISEQLKKVIGYLAHDFKGENTGYIIVLTELCPDPKQGGGTGKNIFGNLFRHITSVCTVSGEQVQFSEKFLQTWNKERIFFIADAPKKFHFGYLKEISTGYGTLKKLYKDETTVSPEDMPKLLVNTNYSYEVSDGGLRRRIIPIEFTNFFNLAGGVDAHFGCMFPGATEGEWSTGDWAGFDHTMAICLKTYFRANGKISATELSDTGWEKQFRQEHGEATYQFITENFETWLPQISVSEFNTQYENFVRENNIQKQYTLASVSMNKAVSAYCLRLGLTYDPKAVDRDPMTKNVIKVKRFVTDQDDVVTGL